MCRLWCQADELGAELHLVTLTKYFRTCFNWLVKKPKLELSWFEFRNFDAMSLCLSERDTKTVHVQSVLYISWPCDVHEFWHMLLNVGQMSFMNSRTVKSVSPASQCFISRKSSISGGQTRPRGSDSACLAEDEEKCEQPEIRWKTAQTMKHAHKSS